VTLALDACIFRLACRQDGLFTTAQAGALGAKSAYLKRRLDEGTIVRVLRGVYRVSGAPASWRQTARALCMAVRGAVVAGRAAAALLGLEPFREGPIDIAVPRGRRTTLLKATETDLNCTDVIDLDGIPVMSVVRTLFDLASRVPLPKLERAVDSAIRQRLTTAEELGLRAHDLLGRGRAGSAKMQSVLELLGVRSIGGGPVQEFFGLLEAARLPLPVIEYPVRLPDGEMAYLDAAYEDHRVAIEIDDYTTHCGPGALDKDHQRENDVSDVLPGWTWRRFTPRHIRRRPQWVAVKTALALGLDPADHQLPATYDPKAR
jgi:hypothetical protein